MIDTLLQTMPWPQVLLGLAAALATLVIYDVAYVWPLNRRFATLAQRCRGLEDALADLPGLARRIAELDRRGVDDVVKLGERMGHLELATEGHAYEQAIGFAAQGGDPDRLMACFGLTRGEAELVTLLHGARSSDGANEAQSRIAKR